MKGRFAGEKNPMYGIQINLGKECKKETRDKISKANTGNKHSRETIYKIKEARKYQQPTFTSSIEFIIRDFLAQLKIWYIPHKHIKIEHSYQCDIFVPILNLIIECDGDYWHNYPNGNDIDNIRTQELKEKGFKVLRLWEHDINKMNLKEFKNILSL